MIKANEKHTNQFQISPSVSTNKTIASTGTGSQPVEIQSSHVQNLPRVANWYLFATAFFLLAQNECQRVIHQNHVKEDDRKIFFSLNYNIKHGIETIIKFLKIKDDPSMDGNNIKDKHSLLKSYDDLADKTKSKYEAELKELVMYIMKYDNLAHIKKYISIDNVEIQDFSNTFFRFAEPNTLTIKIIDYNKLTQKIQLVDFIEINDDIVKLIVLAKKLNKENENSGI